MRIVYWLYVQGESFTRTCSVLLFYSYFSTFLSNQFSNIFVCLSFCLSNGGDVNVN